MAPQGTDVIGDRTWTWTLSSEQLKAFWKLKTMHLFSHGIEVQLKLTGDARSPAILQITVSQAEAPPAGREDVPNVQTRRR